MGIFSWFNRGKYEYHKDRAGNHWTMTQPFVEDLPFDNLISVYCSIPHLRAVIDKKAEYYSNAKFSVSYKDKDGNHVKDEKHSLNAVLSTPNYMQSMGELLFMSMVYRSITGDAFLYKKTGLLDSAKDVKSIWNIDYTDFEILLHRGANVIEADRKSDYIKKYRIWIEDRSFDFNNPEDLLHIRDYGISYKDAKSKIESLREPLQNIYKALKSRGILASRQGGIGIIVGDARGDFGTTNLLPKEKEDLERRVNEKSITSDRGGIHVTDVPLKWQSMVFPTKDLMLFEEIEDDFRVICDQFGISRHCFEADTTFNNKEIAEISLYQNLIIPEWKKFASSLTSYLKLDQEDRFIDVHYDHIQILQENEVEREEVLNKKSERLARELELNVISLEEYRRAMGYV